MAKRTKALLFSRTFFTSCGSGANHDAAEIRYLLLFREFQLVAYYLAKLTNHPILQKEMKIGKTPAP